MLQNISKRAPRWFRKLQRAIAIIQDTVIVILLAMGHGENSLVMLIIRIGVSNTLKMIEVVLKEDDDEAGDEAGVAGA